MRRLLLIAAIPFVLAGCQTVEEMAAEDAATCASYGAPFGSQAHFQCRMIQQQRRDIQSAQAAAAIQSAVASMNCSYATNCIRIQSY